jgi:hypothetical protein
MHKPISENFEFSEFLSAMHGATFKEIITKGSQEIEWARGISIAVKGAVENRRRGSRKYALQVENFVGFVLTEKRPSGISDSEFLIYRPIVEELVKQGWETSMLKLFDGLSSGF